MTSAQAATTTRTLPYAPSRTVELQPDDVHVAITTRHLFGLQRVRASVRLLSGQVDLDPSGALLGLEAELDAASFASGSRSRDAAVASSRLLDAGQHPRLSFRSTSTSATSDGGWLVKGTLTARGVASPTTLLLHPDAGAEADVVGGPVTATARIDRFAHGITAGRGLASRHLDVLITVTVKP